MLQIPISMNGAQSSRLRALLLHGKPQIVIQDDNVNGSPLLVVVARGDMREWLMSLWEAKPPTAEEEAEAAAPAPEPAPPGPPVKKVAVSEGPRAAGSPIRRS